MAENEASGGDHRGAAALITGGGAAAATTFSQLLFAADDDEDEDYKKHVLNYSVSASSAFAMENPPKMLCFSDPCSISTLTCSSDSKLKRRNGSDPESAAIKAAPFSNKRASKKIKADGHAKRKEKLGERITALQQLVSPFGKTDTASVLHEAMGYIKFLHEQVQVLCSPYLHSSSSSSSSSATGGRETGESEVDLRSRGLCLIPVECSLHMANCTVADFWSPPMAMGRKL